VVLFQIVRPEEKPSIREGLAVNLKSKLMSEVIGTFILVFTVGLNVLGGSPAGAFSIAAALACMIYAIGDISGGHFNPAVTLAIHLCGKAGCSTTESCYYAASQLGGGVLGALSYAFVHGKTFPLGPGVGHDWTSVAVAEFMFTFVLTFVVLGVAVVDKKPAAEFTGLIIGSCVTAGGCAIGSVSGGCLNPAVSVGVAGAHILGGGFFVKAIFYAAFQLMGAAAAAGVFRTVYAEEVQGSGKEALAGV
jgi:aquaporin Z